MERDTDDDQLPPDKIARRMERGLRRALTTPPQPHGRNPTTPRAPRVKEAASKGRVLHKAERR